MDANIARIYAQLFNVHPKTKTAKSDKYLWEFCGEILPKERFVDYNYALLDFGGLICQSKVPKCEICPFLESCFFKNQE
ncbi:MAG: hypothetical protein GF364_15590 [Candidatus Lokiarchaeota archaeon]|nr:hypothetical protein [Candidatus Lokiarchaeota archaeon]